MAHKEGFGDDIDDICRLCAVEAKNEVVIYSSEGMHLCLEDKIMHCLRIKISKDDILPKRVCCPCRSRLEEFYLFAQQANKVQCTLETLVKKKKYSVSVKWKTGVNMEKEIDVKNEFGDLPLDVISSDLNEHSETNARDTSECNSVVNVMGMEVLKYPSLSPKKLDRSAFTLHQSNDDFKNKKENLSQSNSTICYLPSNTGEIFVNSKQDSLVDNKSYEDEKYLCNDPNFDGDDEIDEDGKIEIEKEEIEQDPENDSVICHIPYEVGQNTSDTSRSSLQQLVDSHEEQVKDENTNEVNDQSGWKTHGGIKCNQCDQIFPFRSQFDEHYKTSYDKKPIYTCSYCSKTMEKYSTFRSHCYRHVTEGRYRCEYCKKGFSLRSMLDVHILAKHTAEKPFICEECGKGFVTRPGLNMHLKKHKIVEKTEYPCLDCGKILHTSSGLKAHQNVHKLGRRFMCDICGKTFTQKVNMQQHVKHHTGERPYTCEKCGKCFAEKSHLNRHYSFHSEKRPFQCTVCLKMYKTERCLKVHSMVHAEARPYVCKYCNKGFLSMTKLNQHYNIHTGERPYACKYCERTFTNYPNWLKHTRRRHKVDLRKSNVSSQERLKLSDIKPQEQPCEQSDTQIVQATPLTSLLEDGSVTVHSQLSKTFPQFNGRFENASRGSSTSSSSTGMLHQYPHHSRSDVQSLSTHQIEDSHCVTGQQTHQLLQQQFTLTQVYTDHIMVTGESEPDSILPL